ncbi:MAG: hypothetical protein MZV63_24640 [Marinilabiliales bacterium]|nr:hypothetical protein [Marinilabiliales bacterium]
MMIAARIKITTIACFLYFLMKVRRYDPDLCKEKAIIGSSNISSGCKAY